MTDNVSETTPLVSIGLPLYNMSSTVEKAVRTLLDQTYDRLELIISDNASDDGSYEIAMRLAEADPRIVLVRQKSNIGAFNNALYTLEHSSGEFFMWAGADDYWAQDHVSSLVVVLNSHPNAGVAMSAVGVVTEEGERTDTLRFGEAGLLAGGERDVLFKQVMDGEYLYKKGAIRLRWRTKLNMFYYGLYRKSLLTSVQPVIRNVPSMDRVMIALLALTTNFGYSDKVTYHRTVYRRSYMDRHADEMTTNRRVVKYFQTVGAIFAMAHRVSALETTRFVTKLFMPWVVARMAFYFVFVRYK